MVNAFAYDYPEPGGSADPLYVDAEIVRCPWNAEHRLARIALRGRSLANADRPPSNLVFLIDVSGSMDQPDKLPLLKLGLRLLVEQLREGDRIAIVTYADEARIALASTPAERRAEILEAIDALQAGGSTNGSAGLEMAYQVAAEHFEPEGTNRVVLATDGDFNLGVTGDEPLVRLIAEKAESHVFLTILGFGSDNLQDGKLEAIADRGNGHYHVLDSEAEARRVLVDQLAGTLVTIAQDVKLQVDFNPARVGAYRLIGYENRMLEARDFHDDTRDAGDVGAGHSVTALYELAPPVHVRDVAAAERSRYVTPAAPARPEAPESFTVHLRYKRPGQEEGRQHDFEIIDDGRDYSQGSDDIRFAAAVAAFGMILRNSPHLGNATLEAVVELAESALGEDPEGRRAEFVTVVRKALELSGQMP
jgi:Ca-activated chloride channel family protein